MTSELGGGVNRSHSAGTVVGDGCARESFVSNFPAMMWRKQTLLLCALLSACALSAWGQDATDSDTVRPSGVSGPVRKAKAVTARDRDDADEEPQSARKTKSSKSSHASSHRKRAKAKEDSEDTIPAPTEFTPEGIPKTSAASVIVVDANNGKILYEKNPDQIRPAASTQKLLTALIVAESGFLDRPVTVQSVDGMCDPVKLNIKPGDTYQRIDLLRALLVKSPNDVARCLARDNAGSIEAFAEVMNRRAQQLGAVHSHFVNPNGLPVPGQYSSARDLSLIARAAYANATIRSIVCLPQTVFRYANGRTRELQNTNRLLRQLPYCNGMKTGYTDAAGKCLIASGTRPGKDVIVVVLGDSSSRVWRDAGALLNWGLVM
ncbi:MAG TPA: D-alanyl-D-alanine carboxypeptidase family protein [Candidatus Udaeobacter sp.]|nr:D-alanyl-D-alanine carboxypeptidase family protein [Candidatus Udaeobacter sp.]